MYYKWCFKKYTWRLTCWDCESFSAAVNISDEISVRKVGDGRRWWSWVCRRSNTGAECLMWQLEIVRMRGDTVLQLPQPWSVTQSACQSVTLWDSKSVYSCVINMCESLCMCVCVSVFILRQWIWKKWQCGVALCQSPSKVACVSALLTDALILLANGGGCKCGTCLVTERHSLHDNSACRQDMSSQVWCEGGHCWGPGLSEGEWKLWWSLHSWRCSNYASPHSLLFLNGWKGNLLLPEVCWHGSYCKCTVYGIN